MRNGMDNEMETRLAYLDGDALNDGAVFQLADGVVAAQDAGEQLEAVLIAAQESAEKGAAANAAVLISAALTIVANLTEMLTTPGEIAQLAYVIGPTRANHETA